MKKVIVIMLAVLLALAMSSCALLYDENDLEFKYTNDPVVEPNNTNTDPLDGEEDPGIIEEPTPVEDWFCENGFFVCDDYQFLLPERWRGAIDCDTTTSITNGYTVVTRRFYYVELDGDRALLMTLATASRNFQKRYGASGAYRNSTVMAISKDDARCHILLAMSKPQFPQTFTDNTIYYEILTELGLKTFVIEPLN